PSDVSPQQRAERIDPERLADLTPPPRKKALGQSFGVQGGVQDIEKTTCGDRSKRCCDAVVLVHCPALGQVDCVTCTAFHVCTKKLTVCKQLVEEGFLQLSHAPVDGVACLIPSALPTPGNPQLGLKVVAQVNERCVISRPRNRGLYAESDAAR